MFLVHHTHPQTVFDDSYKQSNAELRVNGLTSGTANLVKTGVTVDDDFNHAIHTCSYTNNAQSNTIAVTDRYDFAPNNLSDIQGVAVDTMYKA